MIGVDIIYIITAYHFFMILIEGGFEVLKF